jgi:hypothetical protein
VDKTHQKRRAGGVAQDVDTEFKPQYCKKEKKKILFLKEPLVGMLVVQWLLSSGLCILGQSLAGPERVPSEVQRGAHARREGQCVLACLLREFEGEKLAQLQQVVLEGWLELAEPPPEDPSLK